MVLNVCCSGKLLKSLASCPMGLASYCGILVLNLRMCIKLASLSDNQMRICLFWISGRKTVKMYEGSPPFATGQ